MHRRSVTMRALYYMITTNVELWRQFYCNGKGSQKDRGQILIISAKMRPRGLIPASFLMKMGNAITVGTRPNPDGVRLQWRLGDLGSRNWIFVQMKLSGREHGNLERGCKRSVSGRRDRTFTRKTAIII